MYNSVYSDYYSDYDGGVWGGAAHPPHPWYKKQWTTYSASGHYSNRTYSTDEYNVYEALKTLQK